MGIAWAFDFLQRCNIFKSLIPAAIPRLYSYESIIHAYYETKPAPTVTHLYLSLVMASLDVNWMDEVAVHLAVDQVTLANPIIKAHFDDFIRQYGIQEWLGLLQATLIEWDALQKLIPLKFPIGLQIVERIGKLVFLQLQSLPTELSYMAFLLSVHQLIEADFFGKPLYQLCIQQLGLDAYWRLVSEEAERIYAAVFQKPADFMTDMAHANEDDESRYLMPLCN